MLDALNKKFELEALESFDPKAFKGNEKVPQYVCNFVLTLALVFNDLRDLLYVNEYLRTIQPKGTFKISRKWGNYGGLMNHFNRNLLALIRELFKIIYKNQEAIEHPFFKAIINELDRPSQNAWKRLINLTKGKPSDTEIGRFLVAVRDQFTFHYDSDVIYIGYNNFFSSGIKAAGNAYISNGINMAKTRYYFADAAVNGFINIYSEKYSGLDIVSDTIKQIEKINFAIMNIIFLFITKRGFEIRKTEEEK